MLPWPSLLLLLLAVTSMAWCSEHTALFPPLISFAYQTILARCTPSSPSLHQQFDCLQQFYGRLAEKSNNIIKAGKLGPDVVMGELAQSTEQLAEMAQQLEIQLGISYKMKPQDTDYTLWQLLKDWLECHICVLAVEHLEPQRQRRPSIVPLPPIQDFWTLLQHELDSTMSFQNVAFRTLRLDPSTCYMCMLNRHNWLHQVAVIVADATRDILDDAIGQLVRERLPSIWRLGRQALVDGQSIMQGCLSLSIGPRTSRGKTEWIAQDSSNRVMERRLAVYWTDSDSEETLIDSVVNICNHPFTVDRWPNELIGQLLSQNTTGSVTMTTTIIIEVVHDAQAMVCNVSNMIDLLAVYDRLWTLGTSWPLPLTRYVLYLLFGGHGPERRHLNSGPLALSLLRKYHRPDIVSALFPECQSLQNQPIKQAFKYAWGAKGNVVFRRSHAWNGLPVFFQTILQHHFATTLPAHDYLALQVITKEMDNRLFWAAMAVVLAKDGCDSFGDVSRSFAQMGNQESIADLQCSMSGAWLRCIDLGIQVRLYASTVIASATMLKDLWAQLAAEHLVVSLPDYDDNRCVEDGKNAPDTTVQHFERLTVQSLVVAELVGGLHRPEARIAGIDCMIQLCREFKRQQAIVGRWGLLPPGSPASTMVGLFAARLARVFTIIAEKS